MSFRFCFSSLVLFLFQFQYLSFANIFRYLFTFSPLFKFIYFSTNLCTIKRNKNRIYSNCLFTRYLFRPPMWNRPNWIRCSMRWILGLDYAMMHRSWARMPGTGIDSLAAAAVAKTIVLLELTDSKDLLTRSSSVAWHIAHYPYRN